ncbi:MAG: DUF2007 domain-containing protein [Chromatiales bacterium]|nr:DUF2007 domain-containing protein [Chromatiales bacterium]
MQRLYVAAHIHEAHIVRGLLAAAGIDARVLNEYAPGAGGELPLTEVGPEVWIEDEGDPRARTAGRRGLRACGHDRQRATLPACGEESLARLCGLLALASNRLDPPHHEA